MTDTQAHRLFVSMRSQLKDRDHLLEDYRVRAVYIRFLESQDYELAVEACKKFKQRGYFPSVAEFDIEMHPDDKHDYIPQPISTQSAAALHIQAARESLSHK